jgi:hypothetical protein
MHGRGDTDDALEAMLLKAELKRRQGTFGGEAAAPPYLVQLEPYLDLVDTRPVIELIETDPADSGAGGLVDSRPRAEPVHAPLSQAPFGELGDSVRRQGSPTPDGRVVKEALKLDAVLLTPGT